MFTYFLDQYFNNKLSQQRDPTKANFKGYLKQLPLIKRLYKETMYWHGTGRYQYRKLGESKYQGVSSEINDVLLDIISDGGIKPFFDPFVLPPLKQSLTISLSRNRVYGNHYANLYQYEDTRLKFTNGDIDFWCSAILSKYIANNPLMLFIVLGSGLNPLQALVKNWVSSRRKVSNKSISFRQAVTLKSDIKGNYGILFGISKGIKEVPVMGLTSTYEARTDELIPFSKITHIEVPMDNVAQTLLLLDRYHISTPVIAKEYVELFSTRFNFKELVAVRVDKK